MSTRDSALLPLPAKRAAREIALRWLGDATDAAQRLAAGDDPEALHDFRVALRRLRSCLRAHDEVLGESVPKKAARRLRAVARATGSSRDAEVHLAWLREQLGGLRPQRRVGAQWLIDRTEREKAEADAELLRETADDFARVRHTLARSLASYTTTVRLDAPSDEPPYAGLAARLIEEHAAELARHLAAVSTSADRDAAHEARIAGKRLRYLLEPLAGELEGVAPVLKRLKVLQDALGDLHDAHVFCEEITEAMANAAAEHARRLSATVRVGTSDEPDAERAMRREMRRDARPGLLALVRTLHDREARVFADVQRDWLGAAAEPFFSDVRAVADAARSAGAPGGRTDVEIERKFLLRALPERVRGLSARDVDQGYLPGTRFVERLRRVRDGNGERLYRTVKLGRGTTRTEVEEEAPRELFEAMWPLTEGRRVRKRRYRVPDGDLVWEVDEFTDRDLVLAEVELPSEATPADPPDWLRPYVVRDVTDEDEYVNARLAR